MTKISLRKARGGVIAAVPLVAAIILAGCGGGTSTGGAGEGASTVSAKQGGVLHIGQLAEPTTLNPSAIVEFAALEVTSQINEPLYKLDESGKLVPLLATGYKRSKDGLTWTIGIRENVEFSDGKPMSAADVVFSLEVARKSPIFSGLWEEVESVKALSPTSVQIKTKRPMAALVADLTSNSIGIVPQNYGGVSEKEFAQHPVGTGPYMLKKWEHGQSITLVRNPRYREANLPPATEVVFTKVPDDNSRLSQFKSGELDVIGQPSPSQIAPLEQEPGVRVGNYGMFILHFIDLNLHKAQFKNANIREAINLAVDREAVANAGDGGAGQPAGSYLPPSIRYYDQSLTPPAQNVARATELVEKAESEGVDPTFTLSTSAGQAYGEITGQILQQELSEAGFTIKLEPLDTSALIEENANGELEALLAEYGAGVPDPSEPTSFLLVNVAQPNGVDTKPLEALAARASSALDSSKREELYAQLQKEIADEKQIIALDYGPAIWAMKSSVAGLEVNSVNYLFLKAAGFSQ